MGLEGLRFKILTGEWFENIQAMVREEIEDLLVMLHRQLKPQSEFDQAFAEFAAEDDKRRREGTVGGRPPQDGGLGVTAVIALADLFERVTRPRGGVWNLRPEERSRFAQFMRAALLPLDNDDLSENAATRWTAARKIMKPRKGLRALGSPSQVRLRLTESPREQGSTLPCTKPARTRRKSVLRPKQPRPRSR